MYVHVIVISVFDCQFEEIVHKFYEFMISDKDGRIYTVFARNQKLYAISEINFLSG